MQLEYPLREDGPIQQFGHDAVFGAEDGIDGLLGDPCLLSDGFHRCFGVPAFKEKALRGVKDVEAGLVCLTLADGRGILAGRVFSILTVILSGSIALERIELTLSNSFLSNDASNLRGKQVACIFYGRVMIEPRRQPESEVICW